MFFTMEICKGVNTVLLNYDLWIKFLSETMKRDKGEALGSTMLAYKQDLSPSYFLYFFHSSNIYL